MVPNPKKKAMDAFAKRMQAALKESAERQAPADDASLVGGLLKVIGLMVMFFLAMSMWVGHSLQAGG